MSATSAPFGLRPAFHPSGLDRAQALAGGIASAYGSDILKGQPVKYNPSAGTIVIATVGAVYSGAFAGVEWTDTTGRRRISNYWPTTSFTKYKPMPPLLKPPSETSTTSPILLLVPTPPVCLQPPWVSRLPSVMATPATCELLISLRMLTTHGAMHM